MTDDPAPRPFQRRDLARRKPLGFRLEPDADMRAAMAERLGASAIRKLRFSGELRPEGREDWVLEGELGATVVQPCVVTLAPVVTRIDTVVVRRYLADWPEPEPGSETEMGDDDTIEPLGDRIDPAEVMAEALALAMPDYPRSDGTGFGSAEFAPPGAEPLREEHPFAALAKIRRDGGT